jgi:ATP-dependent Clp protease ATP-binding subunit ClpA
MGARPMARTIQEKVENILAKKLLASELKKGDTITFTSRDF